LFVVPKQRRRKYMSDWNTGIIEEFRASGGKVGGQFEGPL
jgi:hypothetical protein